MLHPARFANNRSDLIGAAGLIVLPIEQAAKARLELQSGERRASCIRAGDRARSTFLGQHHGGILPGEKVSERALPFAEAVEHRTRQWSSGPGETKGDV